MGTSDFVLYFGWPWGWLTVLAGALALAAGTWGASRWLSGLVSIRKRRLVLWTLRGAALLLLALYALQPFIRTYKPTEDTTPVTVMLDKTGSMNLPGMQNGTLREELARKAVEELTGPFRKNGIPVKISSFGGEGEPAGTDLARAVDSAAGDNTIVILVTDGAHNAPSDTTAAATSLRGRGGVVHSVLIGDETLFDIGIKQVRIDRRIGLHTEIEVTVNVFTKGAGDRALKAQIKDADGKVVAEKIFRSSGTENEVAMRFVPIGEGLKHYTLELPVIEGEIVKENNSAPIAFEVANRKLKVLYMEGSQYRRPGRELWEHQFLQQALEEDPDIQVTPLLRDESSQAPAAGVSWVKHPTKGYPRTRRQLFEYDVIISSDIDIEYFTTDQLAWTVEFVGKHGGGFAMVGGWTAFGPGGYDNSVIDKMLPVDMLGRYEHYVENEEFHWRLTPDALSHPIMIIDSDPTRNKEIWDKMPAFFGHNRVERAKPAAIVLAVHPTDRNLYGPAVILAVQDFGNGRSLALTTDTTAGWGEAFEDEWGENGDNRYFRAFWKNAVRWLATYRINFPERHLTIETTRVTAHPGERLAVTMNARDGDFEPTDKITGTKLEIVPAGGGAVAVLDKLQWRKAESTSAASVTGIFRTEIEAPPPGTYMLRATANVDGVGEVSDSMGLAVSEVDVERAEPLVRRDVVTKMAEITGGRVVTSAEAGDLARSIMREPVFKRHFEHIELFYWWPVLAAVIVLLCIEWALRKRWGAA
jgi:uncharacterized membrane protein